MLAVTTALRGNGNLTEKAVEISSALNIPYLPRDKKSIQSLLESGGLSGVVVVGRGRISCVYPGGEFFFHPGMALLRIKEIISGKTDQMIKALDLRPGDSVLDCTLGLGSDAIVMSYINEGGEVTGIEQSPVISLIVGEGLSAYTDPGDSKITACMRRIKVICADHRDYLGKQPDNSLDTVYFDPMFRVPGKKSCAIAAIRPLADYSPLSVEAVREAFRVARRRVVIKEARGSPEFTRLGVGMVSGGRYSPVAYGIIEKRGGRYQQPSGA